MLRQVFSANFKIHTFKKRRAKKWESSEDSASSTSEDEAQTYAHYQTPQKEEETLSPIDQLERKFTKVPRSDITRGMWSNLENYYSLLVIYIIRRGFQIFGANLNFFSRKIYHVRCRRFSNIF